MNPHLLLVALALPACTIPVTPREACARFVECVQAQDALEGTTTDVDRYLPDGDCWSGDEIADLCERSCVNGLEWVATHQPELGEACR